MTYFETVFKQQNQRIELFAPVILQEVAIIKDTVDDLVQLRNIFYNTSTQIIIAIAIRITQSDVFGEPLLDPFDYIYQDIQSKPNKLFGNTIAIDLNEKTRRVKVDVLKAVFQDGSVWVSHPENIVTIQPQREIEASDEYISSIDDNSFSPVFYYVENDSCWQCTCGEPNKIDSIKCHRCNRIRSVVKESFNQSVLTLGFSEYQKGRKKAESEEAEIVQKAKERNQKADTNKVSRNKTVYVALCVVITLLAIIIIAISLRPDGSQPEEKEIINDSIENNESLISQTNNSIKQYVDMIGKTAPKGETVNASEEFLNNMDKVFVMGKTGTVEYEYLESMGDTIAMMHWISNDELTEDDYKKFVLLLNDYCGSAGEKEDSDNDGQTESIRWLDPVYYMNVVSWYESNKINIRWELTEDENDRIEKEIEATSASLKPYLDMIGTDTGGDTVKVNDEFLENINNVYVMGYIGTVSHSTTVKSGDSIALMEWISNESIESSAFEDFINALNLYFNDTAIVSHYDNVTSENVWAWHITDNNLWPICFLENNRINIRWYDKAAVDIPTD